MPEDSERDVNASPRAASQPADFATLYRPLLREAFVDIVRDALARGADAAEQARAYAERGKPDFTLGYLLATELPDDEKQAIFARAHEQRARNTERRAKEFDTQFHRPFPLLASDAAWDRTLARHIRAGRSIQPGAGRPQPTI